ncbi:AAA family ATPase [Vibrio owensii]|uniref:AAA family ATPase n=1 Tax=Vibrio owensii TaxID=696485 RepID=UPI0038CECE2F
MRITSMMVVDECAKFNLIYGWNGSGKSTSSRLFRCIENKSLDGTNYTESAKHSDIQ